MITTEIENEKPSKSEQGAYEKGAVLHTSGEKEEFVVDLSQTAHLEEMIFWLDDYSRNVEAARAESTEKSTLATKRFYDLYAKLGIPAEAFQ